MYQLERNFTMRDESLESRDGRFVVSVEIVDENAGCGQDMSLLLRTVVLALEVVAIFLELWQEG